MEKNDRGPLTLEGDHPAQGMRAGGREEERVTVTER